ncbi:hypothetical protein [Inconstantimicrobium mannanitabidum]|uniref:Uncharacterized protein n=1 Tax=Inconstantimicrobium mannanitabidum TaxID=1604901 RepID=A0ACB5RIJ4_9CLOT|nr:hypothetical protein [Clostridium sp. TW13]GKX68904.1 hypothetical protein rsdtw13_41620 [Clostridium sp. TW13]
MRILIKEKDKRAIKIVFPNFIINVGLRIAMRCMKVEINEANTNRSKEKVYFGLNQFQGLDKKIFKQALKELKKYKGLEIVNVESKDEKVSIVI